MEETLAAVFGHSEFRSELQEKAVSCIVKGISIIIPLIV